MKNIAALSVSFPFFLFAVLSSGAHAQESAVTNLKSNLDLPFEAVGGIEEEEEYVPEIVVFYGQLYEANGIFFCCDISRSMEGAPFKRLQQEVIENIRQFSDRSEFGIVLFNSIPYLFPPSGKPARATKEVKAAAEQWIRSIKPAGASCYQPALLNTLNFANQCTVRRKVIITLGDGMGGLKNCCPGYDQSSYKEETLTSVSQRNFFKVNINAICLGSVTDVDEAWMQRLARENNGRYARIVQ